MSLESVLPILNGLTVSVFVIDADRHVMLVNEAGADVFGDDLVGADFAQAVRNPKCLEAIGKVLAGRNSIDVVVTLQNPVRTTYHVTVTRLAPNERLDDKGQARAVVSLENISHIYEAEQMRSEFVANVSHELRSPLTVLNGFIETLRGPAKNDAEARERFLTIMEKESSRMERLIGDLLSLSKVEVSEHARPQEQADVCLILRKTINILKPQAEAEQISLVLEEEESCKKPVLGDDDQLSQVFLNLIENAIKYSGKNTVVTVSTRAVDRAPGIYGPAIAVCVADNGQGIAVEHIPRLTERFYRVDDSRSREKGGTGLGLAIVKHILARHRGRLSAKSEIGKGSEFTVYLPVAETAAQAS